MRGFYESAEYQSRPLDAGQRVDTLYRGVLGREPDPGGKAHWLQIHYSGVSIGSMAVFFTQSAEFSSTRGAICAEAAPAAPTPPPPSSITYYAQEQVSSVDGRAFADADCPSRWLNMSVFGWTPSGVAQPVAWNLGAFTGAQTPAPVSPYQRGVAAGWYGSSSVQLAHAAGCQNHTWSIPGGGSYNFHLANCQLKYKWTAADDLRPWRHGSSRLRLAFQAKVPTAYFEGGAVGYVYSSLLLQDLAGNALWIQPHVYDSRGAPLAEYVGWDVGTRSAFANTFYRGDGGASRFGSGEGSSQGATGQLFSDWRWFVITINASQLLAAVGEVNGRYGGGLSGNAADYRLLLLTVQNEIYWPTGNGHLGMAVRNLKISEER